MPLNFQTGQMIGGGLMVVVGLAAIGLARRRRWGDWGGLGCGAVVCVVTIVMKRVVDTVVSRWLSPHGGDHVANVLPPPDAINLLAASLYLGLLTGCTLILYTFVAGLIWRRRLTGNARRAFGVGLGIGAFEAIFYGVRVAAGLEPWLRPSDVLGATPILILPVERVVVIVCHTAAAAMALYAVATNRWRWFAAAFAFFTGLDGLAGFYIIARPFNSTNPWLLELSFAAFAVGSIPILRYLWRHWPPPPTPLPLPRVAPGSPGPAGRAAPPARMTAGGPFVAVPDFA